MSNRWLKHGVLLSSAAAGLCGLATIILVLQETGLASQHTALLLILPANIIVLYGMTLRWLYQPKETPCWKIGRTSTFVAVLGLTELAFIAAPVGWFIPHFVAAIVLLILAFMCWLLSIVLLIEIAARQGSS